jgi:hypothetical protein
MAISTIGTASISGLGYGFKNRIINGAMQISQRATSGTSGSTVPTTTATYPALDRWYAYATGATVTVSQGAGAGANKNTLSVAGAASVTAVGVGQRIEQLNSYDLAGSTATLSVYISNSLLTTVTWTASYATSADTWSSKTQIATGTFTVSATRTQYTTNITIPAAATTGIEILFTVGAQISGTWVIDSVQLEAGTVATSFDWRPYGTELVLCQRYLPAVSGNSNQLGWGIGSGSTTVYATYTFPVTPRTAPTGITISSASHFNVTDIIGVSTAATTVSFSTAGTGTAVLTGTIGTGVTSARPTTLQTNNTAALLLFTGCEL